MQRHAPAFELGQGFQRRIGEHQNGRAFRLGRLGPHVAQILARSLGKHGRRIAGQAKVQASGRQRLQQLRPGWKLQPADPGAWKALFQNAMLLEHDQIDGRLLIADAQLGRSCNSRHRLGQCIVGVVRGQGPAESRGAQQLQSLATAAMETG
ncbi:hypothetical protein SDC9_166114 [bioreactor metagenome]|uniref:Uncharacterized protein n=1 Tax=bioreactor metagenome TaxID=1076179 RepID=A0A645FW41_9ZZZZ